MDDKDQKRYVKESLLKDQQYSAEKRYTYADYASWDDEIRYELIDGVPYMMSAPSRIHQKISVELSRQLANFLKGKPCEVYHAPFDVCLNAKGDDDDTVVQPDILVVCNMSKLDGKRCNGAPDMAIEILSPSSKSHDSLLKFNKYMQTGVREYWIVDPDAKTVRVCILNGGKYDMQDYSAIDTIPVHVLDGFLIDLREVFTE